MKAFHPLRCLFTLVAALPVLAHAHTETGIDSREIWFAWNMDPWVLVPLALSGTMYAIGVVRLWRNAHTGAGLRRLHVSAFALAWIVCFIALISPLDAMADLLFSVHMVQHGLLMLVAAPLFVASKPLPAWLWALPAQTGKRIRSIVASGLLAALWRGCNRPIAAWTVHAAVLWMWHIPLLYQAAVINRPLHIIQHLSFLLSALLFWQAVLDRRHGIATAATGVIYIFTTMMHTGILGALLTFSRTAWYPVYTDTAVQWGYTALEDQQLGGLLMWIPGGVLYVIVTLALMMQCLQQLEQRQRRHADYLTMGRK